MMLADNMDRSHISIRFQEHTKILKANHVPFIVQNERMLQIYT